MNATRLAQLFRELAAHQAEEARVSAAIADELDGTGREAEPPKPPRRPPVREPYRPDPRDISDTARATAARSLKRMGVRR